MDDLDLVFWQKEAKELIHKLWPTRTIGSIPGDRYLAEEYQKLDASIPIIQLEEYAEIVRLVGIFNSHFGDRGVDIFFRGQQCHYDYKQFPSFIRSFFRDGILNITQYQENLDKFNNLLNQMYNEIISDSMFNSITVEPILQHYGLHTRWLDIVDNLPIALKFALGDFNPSSCPNSEDTTHGYLFIYGLKSINNDIKGVHDSENTRLINLRKANDATGLRPHVQHAYLFCDKRLINFDFDQNPNLLSYYANYQKYLLCIVEIPYPTLQQWFGSGRDNLNHLFTDEVLFPDARYDTMLAKLDQLFQRINPEIEDLPMNFSHRIFGKIR